MTPLYAGLGSVSRKPRLEAPLRALRLDGAYPFRTFQNRLNDPDSTPLRLVR
jgi:hypothetical protein